jgi:hypothetical protein
MTAPSMTLEQFRAGPLRDWSGDHSSACAAASEALHAAVVLSDGQRGAVVVTVPDASAQRAVLAYVTSMLADQEELSRLVAKPAPDGCFVERTRILVLHHGTSRRPRGVVARVHMASGTPAPEKLRDEEITRKIMHVLMIAAYGSERSDERILELVLKLFPDCGVSTPEEAKKYLKDGFDKAGEERRRERDEEREADRRLITAATFRNFQQWDALNVSPTVTMLVTNRRQPPMTREQYIASPEFEQHRAENMGLAEMRGGGRQDRALMGMRGL